MKSKKALISILGVATFALTSAFVFATKNTQSYISYADGTVIQKTLNPSDLQQCTFESYTFNGKTNSRKFKYEMSGGKFIEGAILFGDCEYQFVGNNLSEPFGIDNTSKGNQNSNFHIFFNVHGLTRAEFYYTAQLLTPLDYGSIGPQEKIKFTDKCGSGLYEELKDKKYSDITNNENTGFYKQIVNGGGMNITDTEVHSDSIKRPKEVDVTLNAVVFQLSAYTIPMGKKLAFSLTKVVLNYTC